jgi:hypothetical protein
MFLALRAWLSIAVLDTNVDTSAGPSGPHLIAQASRLAVIGLRG